MIEKLINSSLVKNKIKELFWDKEIELITRPASYVIKLENEKGGKLKRIIILKPKGFTSNKINELPPHPEARKARITIRGGIKEDKLGFNPLKKVVKFCYYAKRDVGVEGNYPNALINRKNPLYEEEIKSSRDSFFVVKENGFGFYHNLINLSNEWILLILEKELRLQKEMDIASKINEFNKNKQQIILQLINEIRRIGDRIFKENSDVLKSFLKLDVNEAIPVLVEGLNIYETGKHEPCTIYAIILKFAEIDKKFVLEFLKKSLKNNWAPPYYLNELIKKLK